MAIDALAGMFLVVAGLLAAALAVVVALPLRKESPRVFVSIVVLVPMLAVGLYQLVGNPAALDPAARKPVPVAANAAPDPAAFTAAVSPDAAPGDPASDAAVVDEAAAAEAESMPPEEPESVAEDAAAAEPAEPAAEPASEPSPESQT